MPGRELAPTYHSDAQEGWADQKHRGQEFAPTSFPERVEEVCPADDPQQKSQGLEEKDIHVLQQTPLELPPVPLQRAQPWRDQPTPELSAVVLRYST